MAGEGRNNVKKNSLTDAAGNFLSVGADVAQQIATDPKIQEQITSSVADGFDKATDGLTKVMNSATKSLTALKTEKDYSTAIAEYSKDIDLDTSDWKPAAMPAFLATRSLSLPATLLAGMAGFNVDQMAEGFFSGMTSESEKAEKKATKDEELTLMGFIGDPMGSTKRALGKISGFFDGARSFAQKLSPEWSGKAMSLLSQLKGFLSSILGNILPSLGLPSFENLFASNKQDKPDQETQIAKTEPKQKPAPEAEKPVVTADAKGLEATENVKDTFQNKTAPEEIKVAEAPQSKPVPTDVQPVTQS